MPNAPNMGVVFMQKGKLLCKEDLGLFVIKLVDTEENYYLSKMIL